jgi:hypothetical protein
MTKNNKSNLISRLRLLNNVITNSSKLCSNRICIGKYPSPLGWKYQPMLLGGKNMNRWKRKRGKCAGKMRKYRRNKGN